jgi:hypothetical protein
MNTRQEIEQRLRAAPKPPAPGGLLDKLQADARIGQAKEHRSALRRWFAPTGGRISRWRIAALAAIAIAVLLPLSYGAGELMNIFHLRFEARQVSDDGTITVTTTEVTLSGDFADQEEARRVHLETRELKKAGKYERTFRKEIERNGVKSKIYTYRYTLSNGRVIEMNESDRVKDEEDR